jgi:undecaprenyl diphosphate synthase
MQAFFLKIVALGRIFQVLLPRRRPNVPALPAPDPIPHHVAIIMDGNGRWAQQRGMPRTLGHQQGAEAVKRVVKAAHRFNIKYLTLFGFSTENWQRPEPEVLELMRLLRYYLKAEADALHQNHVRVQVIGNRHEFDADIVSLIEHVEDLTRDNQGLNLIIALNYSGRDDILQAAQKAAKAADTDFDVAFQNALYTANIPDPDLLIRTSGEQRISNFLLWQMAYTELCFQDVLWPDYQDTDLQQAIVAFQRRDRRFGKISEIS